MSRLDEIYLIRHAESELNVANSVIIGRSNFAPVTPNGIKQSRHLGRTLREKHILPDIAYMSPAVRTQVTARESLVAMGLQALKPIYDNEIQELSHGRFEGMPMDSILNQRELERMRNMGRNHKLDDEGAESFNDVSVRMTRAMYRLSNNIEPSDKSRKIFIYTHGDAIRSTVGHLLEFSVGETNNTEIRNTSITKLVRGYDGWEPEYWDVLAEELPSERRQVPIDILKNEIWHALGSLDMPVPTNSLVVASLVQDYLGGTIEHTRVMGVGINAPHFRNIIDGQISDLTIDTHTSKVVISPDNINPKEFSALSIRELFHRDKATFKKYKVLKALVSRNISNINQ